MPNASMPSQTLPSRLMQQPIASRHIAPTRPTPRETFCAPRPVRLTRRGRILLLSALVAVLFGAFSLGRSASEAAPQGQGQPAVEQVTVLSGESLWTVARRIAPDNDPREVIAQIRRVNGLIDSQLRVGQQLLLPVGV